VDCSNINNNKEYRRPSGQQKGSNRLATAAVAKMISYPQPLPPHPSSPPQQQQRQQQQQEQQRYQSQSPTSQPQQQQQQRNQELPAAQYDYCRPIVKSPQDNDEEDEEEPQPLDETALNIIVTAMSERVDSTQPI
jgi:hypothetical protein